RGVPALSASAAGLIAGARVRGSWAFARGGERGAVLRWSNSVGPIRLMGWRGQGVAHAPCARAAAWGLVVKSPIRFTPWPRGGLWAASGIMAASGVLLVIGAVVVLLLFPP